MTDIIANQTQKSHNIALYKAIASLTQIAIEFYYAAIAYITRRI